MNFFLLPNFCQENPTFRINKMKLLYINALTTLFLILLFDSSNGLYSKHQITSLPGLSKIPTDFNMYSGHLEIGNSNLSVSENGSLFYWLL